MTKLHPIFEDILNTAIPRGIGHIDAAPYINDLPRIKDALDRAVDALDAIPDAPEAVRTISSRLWSVLHGETWEGSAEAVKPWVDVTKKEAV